MGLELTNPNQTPPGGFRYKVPDTGQWVPANYPREMIYSWNDLEEAVRGHYRANHIDPPANLRHAILDQLCQILPQGQCRDGNRIIGFFQGIVAEFQRIVQGTITLVDWWISSGRQRVSNEEIERRSVICGKCIFNAPPVGCSSCNIGILNKVVESAIGGDRVPTDDLLQSCTICGCHLRVKSRLPKEVLRRNIPEKQLAQLPPAHDGFPGCWVRDDAA